MLQVILEIPEVTSIKDKRRVIQSLKARVIRKFKISFAEVDLMDSHQFSQLAGAVVSNDKTYGEKVMQRVFEFIERESEGRVHDVSFHSEHF